MSKWLSIFGGVVVVLLLVLAGVGYFLLTTPSATPSQPVLLPKEVTEESPEAAARLDNKIDAFKNEVEEAKERGEKKEITLVATEGEINYKLKEFLAKEKPSDLPIDLKSVKVQFRDGLLYIVVKGQVSQLKVTAIATAEASVVAGKPKITLKNLYVGKLPLPSVVKSRLNELVNQQFDKVKLLDLPIDVSDLEFKDGQIVMRGMTR